MGASLAANKETRSVIIIIAKPLLIFFSIGRYVKHVDKNIETIITYNMLLIFLAGGTIIATNMLYKEIDKALTIISGKTLPSNAPHNVPIVQEGIDTHIAPYI